MKIQLKRSNTLDGATAKVPAPENMAYGEVAVNYNSTDPSIFIKDTDDNIRKLSIVDITTTQSDWAENNQASPAYIKNRQLVTNELIRLEGEIDQNKTNIDAITTLNEAPNDGRQYGRVGKTNSWTPIAVQEADPSGTGYVRKSGGWTSIDSYAYTNKTYVDDQDASAVLLATTTSKDYTDTEVEKVQKAIDDLEADIIAANYLQAPQGTDPTQKYAQTISGTWVTISDSGNGSGSDEYVTKAGAQTISGEKTFGATTRFNNNLICTGSNNQITGSTTFTGTADFNQRVKLNSNSELNADLKINGKLDYGNDVAMKADGSKITFRQKDVGGNPTGNPQNGSGSGGGVMKFLGDSSLNNLQMGIRTDDPEAGLDVRAGIRANQYQNFPTRAVFDGQKFTSLDGFDFDDEARFYSNVIQTKPTFRMIENTTAYSLSSISSAEKAVATAIRAGLRGYTSNGKRKFCIDKSLIVNAFTAEGLDVNDYDLLTDVSVPEHEGLIDDDNNATYGAKAAQSFTAINYEGLFAFLLSAGPDLSALEARVAALEYVP